MMRFANEKPLLEIWETLRGILLREGITLVRADAHDFKPGLWENILVYLENCAFGISIFEQSVVRDYNPNVALETGYMMALGKPVCLLKERTLPNLPSDILHNKYIEYDHFQPQASELEKLIPKWLRDNGLATPCRKLIATFDRSVFDLGALHLEQTAKGIAMCVPKPGIVRFLGVDLDEVESRSRLHFEVDSFASKWLCEKQEDLRSLIKLNGFRIECDSDPKSTGEHPQNILAWREIESKNTCLWQFCLRDSFEGMEDLTKAVGGLLPGPSNKFEEIALFITKDADGFWYFQSNYQPRGSFRSVKALTTKAAGLQYVIKNIVAMTKTLPEAELKRLMDAHMWKIRYIIDPKIFAPTDSRLPLDSGGATQIEVLPKSWFDSFSSNS